MTVFVDETNPASPQSYVNFDHTCYPAHIVKVNGQVVYSYQPPYNNSVYLSLCLTNAPGFGHVTGQQSVNTAVPTQ